MSEAFRRQEQQPLPGEIGKSKIRAEWLPYMEEAFGKQEEWDLRITWFVDTLIDIEYKQGKFQDFDGALGRALGIRVLTDKRLTSEERERFKTAHRKYLMRNSSQ